MKTFLNWIETTTSASISGPSANINSSDNTNSSNNGSSGSSGNSDASTGPIRTTSDKVAPYPQRCCFGAWYFDRKKKNKRRKNK